MNWLQKLLGLLPLIPYLVAGIEQVHGSAVAGASKKQLAMDALGLASGVAERVLPGDAEAVKAATVLAGNVIDGVVATFNASGVFKKAAPASPSPLPAQPAQPAPIRGN